MKKTLWTLPLVAALLVVGSGFAYAIPSLAGPTGIVTVPTAAVAPEGELQTALTYQSQQIAGQGMYGGDMDVSLWQLQALTGVSDEAELWAAYALADQETPTVSETANMWAFGGKYQLTREPEDQTALAIGASIEKWSDVIGMYSGAQDIDAWKLYIVATKDFTPVSGDAWEWSAGGGTRILGSVGIMYMSIDPDMSDRESLTRPFVGLEFVGVGGTTLGLEYRWKDSDLDMDAVFSAVLRHQVSPECSVEVGTTNATMFGLGLDDQDFFARIGYNFPMGGA